MSNAYMLEGTNFFSLSPEAKKKKAYLTAMIHAQELLYHTEHPEHKAEICALIDWLTREITIDSK